MILNSYNNILVLAPHTDDGELGLGGTISKLIELGKKVTYVAFSTAMTRRSSTFSTEEPKLVRNIR